MDKPLAFCFFLFFFPNCSLSGTEGNAIRAEQKGGLCGTTHKDNFNSFLTAQSSEY